jgi:hypothetical protein
MAVMRIETRTIKNKTGGGQYNEARNARRILAWYQGEIAR